MPVALTLRGAHGYDPELPAMAAIFLAYGRGVAAGGDLGVVRVLDVTPTVLDLMQIPIPAALPGRPLLSGGSTGTVGARAPSTEGRENR